MEKGKVKKRDSSSMIELVKLWEKSGATQQAFCKAHEIPSGVFAYWRRRYRKFQPTEMPTQGFAEVCLPGTGSSGCIFARIRFANGVELDLEQRVESAWIKDLLK